MPDMYIDTGYLNQVIRGVIKWRKCPSCDKFGRDLAWIDDDGNEVPVGTEGAEQSKRECESCHGIGFIDITTDADLKGEPNE
jgi:hypothetical protein